MNIQELKKANQILTQLDILNAIMKVALSTPQETMTNFNCDIDQAIQKINEAYQLIQKDAVQTIENSIQIIKPIIRKLIYDNT